MVEMDLSNNDFDRLEDIFHSWGPLYLDISHNPHVKGFPPSMKDSKVVDLIARSCSLSSIENLPMYLERLEVNNNKLIEIPSSFPTSVYDLVASMNQIQTINLNFDESKLSSIDLNQNGIMEFPCELTHLSELSQVSLGYNFISSIPCNLTDMKWDLLGLPHNLLTEITTLPSKDTLESLYLGSNQLSSLPEDIGEYRLITLELQDNQLTSLPSSFPFHNLINIMLGGNKLRSLPEPPVPPESFVWTGIIALDHNELDHFPEFFCEYTNVREIYIDHNNITEIPECIGQMRKELVALRLEHNPISSLPDSLVRQKGIPIMDLSDTLIEVLPEVVVQMEGIQVLILHDLPLLSSLPVLIGLMPSLRVIDALRTGISTVPDEVLVAKNLEVFIIRHSALTRFQSHSFSQPENENHVFRYMDISHNRLYWDGGLPTPCMCNLRNLAYADLSHNEMINFFNCWYISIGFLDVSFNPLISFTSPHMPFGATVDVSHSKSMRVLDMSSLSHPHGDPIYNFDTGQSQVQLVAVDTPMEGFLDRIHILSNLNRTGGAIRAYDTPRVACYPLTYDGYDLVIEPSQLHFIHCWCSTTDHYWSPTERSCKPCPEGLICGRGVDEAVFAVKEGYYPVNQDGLCNMTNVDILSCSLRECASPDICNPLEKAPFECTEGHLDNSPLCARCEEGYFQYSDTCKKCPPGSVFILPLVTILVLTAAVLYGLFKQRRLSRGSSRFGTLESFINWIQVTFLLWRSISTGKSRSAVSTDSLSTFAPLAFTLAYLQPFAWECVVPSVDFVTYFWATFWTPVFVGFALLVTYILLSTFKWKGSAVARRMEMSESSGSSDLGRRERSNIVIFLFILSLQWLYISLVSSALSIFRCIDLKDGSSYLAEAPYIFCDSPSYEWMYRGAIFSYIFYGLGIPIIFFFFVYRYRADLDSSKTLGEFGSLYAPFRYEYRYWGICLIMGRKQFIVLAMILLRDGSFVGFTVFMILIIAGLLHLMAQPYCHKIDNRIEGFLLMLSSLTYFARVVSLMEGVHNGDELLTSILLLNVFVAVMLVSIMVFTTFRKTVKGLKSSTSGSVLSLNTKPPSSPDPSRHTRSTRGFTAATFSHNSIDPSPLLAGSSYFERDGSF